MAEDKTDNKSPPFIVSLLSGGVAGLVCDVSLYPLDTIKTRLQSPQGFLKSGGFKGIYSGLSAAAVGSAPGAALFFSTYETVNHYVLENHKDVPMPVSHMFAASCGEVMACLIRVPTEVLKQRMQAGMYKTFGSSLSSVLATEGFMGLYRGFGITIFREVPFSLLQFPMYEKLKSIIRASRSDGDVPAIQAAACGSFSGAISAAATTPMDVIKTRVMLGADAQNVPYRGVVDCFKRVLAGAFNIVSCCVVFTSVLCAVCVGINDDKPYMF
jgi:solute carrier family 25 S-adenosylmethionine transporter 26